ncbi:hypothetical protein WEI85_36315 [Actinomycetes bacterium KLBMP 9797]
MLQTARVPPSGVDIALAMAAGRRMRRRRRIVAVAAATALAVTGTVGVREMIPGTPTPPADTLVAAGPGAPDPFAGCQVRALTRAVDEKLADTPAADPTGRYVVAALERSDGSTRAVLWADGVARQLPVPGVRAEVYDVNSAGVVVGSGATKGRQFGWVYRDGEVVTLSVADKREPTAVRAVNELGDVLGEAWSDKRMMPVVWQSERDGVGAFVATPEDVTPVDIADDGTVVGIRATREAPIVWRSDGTERRLALPAGASGGQVLTVRGEWATGWVGGDDRAAAKAQLPKLRLAAPAGAVPARWHLTTGEVTTWVAASEPASAVNAAGWVTLPAPSGGSARVARDGQLYELPGSTDAYPMALSDDGRRLYGVRGDELLSWTC